MLVVYWYICLRIKSSFCNMCILLARCVCTNIYSSFYFFSQILMDERHLWFATKLQETFHFENYDRPKILENFLVEPEVVKLINSFLSPREPCKLFFYCNPAYPSSLCTPSTLNPAERNSSTQEPYRKLHVVTKLAEDVLMQDRVCLYILRKNTKTEIDPCDVEMEKELFCGEIRHSALSSLCCC